MTNKEPKITVKSEVKRIVETNPNLRDVVCLIGGFETELEEPKFYTRYQDALEDLYDGSEETLPDANKALEKIFSKEDISGILVVDVTTHTGSGDNITYARNVTKTKLENALSSVSQYEFDLLYVATELTDELITVIDEDLYGDDEGKRGRFTDKKPYDYVGVGTRTGASQAVVITNYTATAEKLGDGCAAFLTQPLIVDNVELSLVESGAWLTRYIARLPVGQSLTAKKLEGVTGLVTSYTFGDEQLGSILNGLGFFVVRLLNPLQNTYEVVNSANPNGLDLYITRGRDYIVNDFALRQFLGEHNNGVTLDSVKTECNNLLRKFRDDLKLVEDINYAVEKVNSKKINVILNTIQFADVITDIDVYLTIEVI